MPDIGRLPKRYYAWRTRPAPAKKAGDAQLAAEIAGAHQRSRGIYGSPRIHRDLKARGVRVGKKRVERLMRENGLRGRSKRRFCCTTDSKHALPIAPNVLGRCFDASAPNRVWVGDVTYIATHNGWLYLAVLLDLFSRRVVGWATSATNDRALALAALDRALDHRRPPPGLLHHTDRGSPDEFNGPSQHLGSEDLLWVHRNVDGLIAQDAIRSVHLGVRLPGDANIDKRSGRRLLAG